MTTSIKKIFVLEDNEDIVDIMITVLSKDYVIEAKMTADNIFEDIQHFKPDLIILDHFVGDANSTSIISNLRKNDPNFSTPVVLFSGHPQLKETATQDGLAGYIEKPANISYIRDYIKKIFEQ
jgi:DNA-binding NtrC family response regulator